LISFSIARKFGWRASPSSNPGAVHLAAFLALLSAWRRAC
jgi:hypothetical protein